MRGIFLDDERYPKDVTWIKYPENIEWFIVRTQHYFMSLLEDEEFNIITFDHDIECYDEEGREVTGYDLLKYVLDYFQINNKKIPAMYFHSMNPVGKENMEAYYNNFVNFCNKEWEK